MDISSNVHLAVYGRARIVRLLEGGEPSESIVQIMGMSDESDEMIRK